MRNGVLRARTGLAKEPATARLECRAFDFKRAVLNPLGFAFAPKTVTMTGQTDAFEKLVAHLDTFDPQFPIMFPPSAR